MTLRRLIAALTTAAVATGAAGCSNDPDKDDKVQVKTEQQATGLVRQHARALATAIGADPDSPPTRIAATPCENRETGETADDGRFYVQGNWQLPLPGPQHPGAFERLRESFTQAGYSIGEDVMFTDVEGSIGAENPADQVQVTVQSTRPATALAITIVTPCYRPD